MSVIQGRPYLNRLSLEMVNFPAPIGGTVLPQDFAPSILFAVLYALLTPLMLYRMLSRRSRCIILIGTIAFSIERVVIFSLRAVQARNEERRFSSGLATYMQISFGMGFIGIADDAIRLARCVLVNPTFGLEKYHQSPAAASKGGVMLPPTADTPDQPRVRSRIRGLTGFLGIANLAATVPGIIANSNYSRVFNSQNDANTTATDRIVSSGVAVGIAFIVVCALMWGYLKLARISKRGVGIMGIIYTLIIMIGIYRLSVMRIRTTSLSAPNVLNTPSAKAAFYVFHVLPEWLASLILFSTSIRKSLGTGLFGDYRHRDETEKERAKREKREAKRELKKKKKLVDTEKLALDTELVDMEPKGGSLTGN